MLFSRIYGKGVRISFGLKRKVLFYWLLFYYDCFFNGLNISFVDNRLDWEIGLFLFFYLFGDTNGIVVKLEILHSEVGISKSGTLFVCIFVFHFFMFGRVIFYLN